MSHLLHALCPPLFEGSDLKALLAAALSCHGPLSWGNLTQALESRARPAGESCFPHSGEGTVGASVSSFVNCGGCTSSSGSWCEDDPPNRQRVALSRFSPSSDPPGPAVPMAKAGCFVLAPEHLGVGRGCLSHRGPTVWPPEPQLCLTAWLPAPSLLSVPLSSCSSLLLPSFLEPLFPNPVQLSFLLLVLPDPGVTLGLL